MALEIDVFPSKTSIYSGFYILYMGYLTVCHDIDGPFIDGLPSYKMGDDFPWLC